MIIIMLALLSVKVVLIVIIVRFKSLFMPLIVMIIMAVGMVVVIIVRLVSGVIMVTINRFIVFPFLISSSFTVVRLRVKGGHILVGFWNKVRIEFF